MRRLHETNVSTCTLNVPEGAAASAAGIRGGDDADDAAGVGADDVGNAADDVGNAAGVGGAEDVGDAAGVEEEPERTVATLTHRTQRKSNRKALNTYTQHAEC